MLKLPSKKQGKESLVQDADGLLEFGVFQFGEAIMADLPDAVKIGIKAHMTDAVDKLGINLNELESEHAKQVQKAKNAVRAELSEFGHAGLQVLQKVQNAIRSATDTHATSCTVDFKPELPCWEFRAQPIDSSLETWRRSWPQWSAHVDIIMRHLAAEGYEVKLSYRAPNQNEDYRYFPGKNWSLEGYRTLPRWDYKNYGTLTMSFDM